MDKLEPLCTVDWNEEWYSLYGKQYGDLPIFFSKNNCHTIHMKMHPKELKARTQRAICTSMLMVAFFTRAKGWKQSKCPSMRKQNMVDIHNGILIVFKKERHFDTCFNTDEIWGHYGKWNKQSQKSRCYMIPFIWDTENSQIPETEKRFLTMQGGESCILWVYLMSLNCALNG